MSRSRPDPKVLVWTASLICAFIVFYLFAFPVSSPSSEHDTTTFLSFPSTSFSPFKSWKYDTIRDERNYGLTDEQCNIAFPDLFKPILQSVARLDKPITQADTVGNSHWGECRAMLYDNELYVLDDWPDEIANQRKFATLHAINRAVNAMAATGHRFPNIEFSLAYQDQNLDRSRPNWAYDRLVNDSLTFLMPDFGLYSWPAHQVGTWPEVRSKTRALQAKLPFEAKIPKLLWRGTVGFGSKIRGALVKASAGRSWSAVEALEWLAPDFKDHAVTMPDHCGYQFVAHTEGLAYSGRLKYLHNCESVIIAHEPDYETHDQHLMIDSGPSQNFVRVKQDWSDLEEKMEWLIAHPIEAARIAKNNVDVFRDRYLTPAAEACYWRRLIHEWAAHSDFEPEFFRMVEGEEKWRGLPYESFVLMGGMDWDAQRVG